MQVNTQKKTLNYNSIKYFLNLFTYAEGKSKEIIDYIIDKLKESEKNNKTLTFDKLNDEEYLPNPLSDRKGNCMFDTKTFLNMYNEYMSRTKYINTRIAEIVKLDYILMNDMVEKKDED